MAAPKASNRPSAHEVSEELAKIVNSQTFVKATLHSRFLKYVVEKRLHLESQAMPDDLFANLKQSVIGHEVFGLPVDHDASSEANVRVEAGRLRKRLLKYYSGEGQFDSVLISLPLGGYVPEWTRLQPKLAAEPPPPEKNRHRWLWMAGAVTLVSLVSVGVLLVKRNAVHFNGTVVVADIENVTSDKRLSGLKEALELQLLESPQITLVSDQKILLTLTVLMKRPGGGPFDAATAREICLRNNADAFISSKVTQIGDRYSITLKAQNCSTGNVIAGAKSDAKSVNEVLPEFNRAANRLREAMGEPKAQVETVDQKLQPVTTSSLDALEDLSIGASMAKLDSEQAIPWFEKALGKDPNFATAYVFLAGAYTNVNQTDKAVENIQKAYSRREQVSRRERFNIEALYHTLATRDLIQADQIYDQWMRVYPKDSLPRENLAYNHLTLGQFQPAESLWREALSLEPDSATTYGNLIEVYMALGELPKAKKMLSDAIRLSLANGQFVRLNWYNLAFLENDEKAMQEQLTWSKNKPGIEDQMTFLQADTEAYFGRLKKARVYTRLAEELSNKAQASDTALGWSVNEGLREAEVGNFNYARQIASRLEASTVTDHRVAAALIFARAGDSVHAQALANQLKQAFPKDTLMQEYLLPTINAAIQLNNKQNQLAIQALASVVPYDLASGVFGTCYPAYVRGLAYLRDRRPTEAAKEFQILLAHRGVVLNFVLGPLAELQLARAQALAGDRQGARRSYEEFFSLWKDADSDTPMLRDARAEYRNLHI